MWVLGTVKPLKQSLCSAIAKILLKSDSFLPIRLNMTSLKTPSHDFLVPFAGMCPELTPPNPIPALSYRVNGTAFFWLRSQTRACMFLLPPQPPHAFQWGRCGFILSMYSMLQCQCLGIAVPRYCGQTSYNFSFLSNFLGRKSTLSNPTPLPFFL